MVSEPGQDRAIEWKRREQAGELGTEHRREARQEQHEGARHCHSGRDVPARQRRRRAGFRIVRHEDERHGKRADHDRHQPGQRQGHALEDHGRRREREGAGQERQSPATAARQPSVEKTERGLRARAGHGADGRRGGEPHALIECEEERDRAGCEWKPDEPAAHAGSPAPSRQADRPDQRGGEHELERQAFHGRGVSRGDPTVSARRAA